MFGVSFVFISTCEVVDQLNAAWYSVLRPLCVDGISEVVPAYIGIGVPSYTYE